MAQQLQEYKNIRLGKPMCSLMSYEEAQQINNSQENQQRLNKIFKKKKMKLRSSALSNYNKRSSQAGESMNAESPMSPGKGDLSLNVSMFDKRKNQQVKFLEIVNSPNHNGEAGGFSPQSKPKQIISLSPMKPARSSKQKKLSQMIKDLIHDSSQNELSFNHFLKHNHPFKKRKGVSPLESDESLSDFKNQGNCDFGVSNCEGEIQPSFTQQTDDLHNHTFDTPTSLDNHLRANNADIQETLPATFETAAIKQKNQGLLPDIQLTGRNRGAIVSQSLDIKLGRHQR